MSNGKRYYWLKLQEDFFDSLRVKKLRKLAGGDTYTIIYLKMQLKALRNDGFLRWKGIEDDFASELALDLDEEPENVAVVLRYLLSCGLAETDDNVSFFLPWVAKNTGSENASAQRVREFRERQALQCNTDVTQAKRLCNAEKELEIEGDNNISSLSKEKQEKEKFSLSDCSSVEKPVENSDEKAARIAHFVDLLHFAEQYGYDKTGTYRLAAEEGITQDEIHAWRAKHEKGTV